MRNSELLYKPLPPSDEGGGFLRSKKTEGETENTVNKHFLFLSHEFLVPAPSSEGANVGWGVLTIPSRLCRKVFLYFYFDTFSMGSGSLGSLRRSTIGAEWAYRINCSSKRSDASFDAWSCQRLMRSDMTASETEEQERTPKTYVEPEGFCYFLPTKSKMTEEKMN